MGAWRVPLDRPIRESRATVRACLRNTASVPLQLVGVPAPNGGIDFNGEPQPQLLTLAFRRAGAESTFEFLGTIAHRFGIVKTTIAGGWTLWAVVALFAFSSAIALRLVLRRDFGEERA